MRPNPIQITDVIQRHLDTCFHLLDEKFEDTYEFNQWKNELYTELSIIKKIIELHYKKKNKKL